MKIFQTLTATAVIVAALVTAGISNAATTVVPLTKPATTSTMGTTEKPVAVPAKVGIKSPAIKAPVASTTGFKCKDGALSKAKSTHGACSGHGGIAK